MKKIAAELLVERLIDWGVDTVFGLPATASTESWRRCVGTASDRVRSRPTRGGGGVHGDGYAKSTGSLGVCLATSGPGGLHLLNGLYDAKLDHVPVLAITGMQDDDAARHGLPAGGPP